MISDRSLFGAISLLLTLTFISCAPTAKVTSYGGPSTQQAQAESYSGPKARIAVSRFNDKTGKGWYTAEIGHGMVDMLTTTLFNTNRFIVLERQILQDVLAEQDLGASGRIQAGTEAPIGKIEGAELLVVGGVTEFEPHAAGAGGGLGAILGGPFGAIAGAFKKAHIAIDLRIVDTRTSRILAATSVEGSATNIGGMVGILGGTVGVGLGGYKNTPTEKAIRVCLQEAVNWIVSQTPQQYFHYTEYEHTREYKSTAKGVAYVKVGKANIRSGPGTQYGVINAAKEGDKLEVIEERGSWCSVRLPDGSTGWIYKNLISR